MGVVAGTAGHIDHGKSSLMRWLTGRDPDRLKEEKLRGITIELGYVFMSLPGGGVLAFIDVPGHEKFVRQMVAGVATIDFFLLVVAADEGVMPQTREHLDILGLLGVGSGLVALTKCDMVDSDMQDLAEADIADLLDGTPYRGSRVLRVSSVTGAGMEVLRTALEEMAAAVAARDRGGRFRLAIDRVFTLQGHGTIVAGTVLSGSVSTGDSVELLPEGKVFRVREIRVNEGRTKGSGTPGDRVALNLVGLEREEAWRGSCLASPGWLKAVTGIDAECTMLAGSGLEPRQRVRFHTGTAEVMARAIPMTEAGIPPGGSGFVHFQLEEPVVAVPGDRFVIRRFSPVHTMGGGVILESGTSKLKRRMVEDRLRRVEMLSDGDLAGILHSKLSEAPVEGVAPSSLAMELGRTEQEILAVARVLADAGAAALFRDGSATRIVSGEAAASAAGRLLRALESYHAEHPLSSGLPSSQVSRLLSGIPQWFARSLLSGMTERGEIRKEGDRLALARHSAEPTPEARALLAARIADIERAGFRGFEAPRQGSADPVLEALLERGEIFELEKGLCSCPSVAEAAGRSLKARFGGAWFRLGELRETLGISRKTAVLWAEQLDRLGITERDGDLRRVRGSGQPSSP